MSGTLWNPLRFVETLAFFGEIPFLGNVRWLQQMLGDNPNPSAPAGELSAPATDIVLLGEQEGRWQAIHEALAARGVTLRSHPLSPGSQEAPRHWVNARALVWQAGLSGYPDLATLLAALSPMQASLEHPVFNFSPENADDWVTIWGAIDDVVMGGVSASNLVAQAEYAQFTGNVSTANSGGFASVRTRNFDPPFNFSNWQGIRLRVRGDGQRYKLILRTNDRWDSTAYCASFDTVADTWIRVDVPFSAMQATFRAKTLPTAPALDPSQVCAFQLMLSKFEYDGDKNPTFKTGPFRLDLSTLGVYQMTPPPPLLAIAQSPEQAAEYADLLANSGLSHQVLTRDRDQETATDFAQQLLSSLPT